MEGLGYQEIVSIIQNEIEHTSYMGHPKELYDPMNYIIQLGGKRLRPVTTLLATQLFSGKISNALPAAKAIEVFHNFTLIHDDIMDKAPLRRGKETVHEKWNDNVAILSGDTLLIEVYNHFLEGNYKNLPEILKVFNQIAVEVCEGQQLDMNFETRDDVTIEEYLNMIRLKTSVLVGGAFKIGALVAHANESDATLIYDFGENLGLAFQLKDDYLDCFGDPEKFGKQVGGDILSNKKTFMMLKALEIDTTGELKRSLHQKDLNAEEKIESVKSLFKKLEVDRLAFDLMDEYYQKAINSLNKIQSSQFFKNKIIQFAEDLMQRAS